MGVGCELCLAEIDGDPSEPREHRSTPERLRAALDRDAVEDRDERDLVALGIAARGEHALHERGRREHPRPEAELEEEDGAQESHVRRVPPHD